MQIKRIGYYIAWAFLALCILVISIVVFAGTNWGLRLAVHAVNQSDVIEITDVSGSLFSEVGFGHVHVASPDALTADIDTFRLNISLRCLLDAKICVDKIAARDIKLTLPPSQQSTPSTDAPSIVTMPFELVITSAQFQSLEVEQSSVHDTQLHKAPLVSAQNLNMRDFSAYQSFKIASLGVEQVLLFAPPTEDGVSASSSAQGAGQNQSLGLPANTPFSLDLISSALATPPKIILPDIFIPVNAQLAKAKIDTLCWHVPVTRALQNCVGDIDSSVTLASQKVSIEVVAKVSEILTSYGMDAETLAADVDVDFANEWQYQLEASIEQAPLSEKTFRALSLIGKGDIHQSDIQVSAKTENESKGLIQTAFVSDLQASNLPLTLQIEVDELSPLNDFLLVPLNVQVSQGLLDIEGDWQQYTINASGALYKDLEQFSGMSNVSLIASASAQDVRLNINELRTDGALGQALVSGEVLLDSQLAELTLQTNLNVSLGKFDIGVFSHDVKSDLNGQVTLEHQYTDSWMRGQMLCEDVKGTVQGYELSVNCDVDISKAGKVSIREMDIRQGNNIVTADGVLQLADTRYAQMTAKQWLGSEAQLNLQVDLDNVNALLETIRGQVNGQGTLSGTLLRPQLDLEASLVDFEFNDIGLEQANVSMTVDAGDDYRTELNLEMAELAIGQTVVNELMLTATGDQTLHTLNLSVLNENVRTAHEFEGTLTLTDTQQKWLGNWRNAHVTLPFSRLQLAQQVPIEADLIQMLVLIDEHCWESDTGAQNICFNGLEYREGIASGQADIAYDIATVLRHYAPDMILAESTLPFASNVEFTYSQEKGLNASAYNRVIGGLIETESHSLALTALVANMDVEENELYAAVFAGSEATGTIGIQSQLNLRPDAREHNGKVRITGLDLSVLERFIPSTYSILGMVNADIDFAGALFEPQLDGYMNINNGELILDAYTYPLTNFNQSIQFKGQQASVNGDFKLGKGTGQYTADLGLYPEFKVRGEIIGTDMQFSVRDSVAQISPDVRFTADANTLTLSGNIAIPSAEIKIEELPENAKTPSTDTIIIGQEPEPPIIPMALDIDLNILIDEPKNAFVAINALDLEAKLSGDLNLKVKQERRLSDNTLRPMTTSLNGEVNILEGSYEAYGQMLLVRSGKIFFSGEPSLPQFDIRAIRNPLNTNGDVIAGVQISGNPVMPRVELFSEPPMIQAKQLSYLLQGQDLTSGAQGDSVGTDTTLINMLVNFGVGRSENGIGRFGRAIGFDALNVGTAGAGDSTQVQISGRLSENIQITYGIGVFDSQSVVALKYQILPKLFIEAKSGINNSVDLFYQMTRGENE
ncbi:translocation/assembly module TamB domain-containing protein [Glaciecola sp. XM2]|uniref:translocation/assembly module TamB domain-containing protein n=1 Tax=Glaciecola sp. XM2 TaxID=1914931 RepID=UPI001BDF698A|nr:translocation/assembly module TamB domain-containing protein [Glaciecola sp. XM2]MBT1450290.1 translocation/assembly module TamB domain-containing protein [Glaciecola sp. XM2]